MIRSGQTTVAAAGTEVVLVARGTFSCRRITIKALFGNAGMIYVGNTDAGTVSSATGYELDNGQELVLEGGPDGFIDPGEILVDTSNSGDKVSWIAVL